MPKRNISENILKPVFDRLKEGDIDSSCSLAAHVLEENLEEESVKCTYHAIIFWKEKLNMSSSQETPFDKGEYLFSQWASFLAYMKKYGETCEFVLYALKVCMFQIIIDFYLLSLKLNKKKMNRAQVYRKLGLCYKLLGNYEKAVEFLKYASSLNATSSAILAELADSYAMCGDERLSKVYFREAFFKDALSVEEVWLESSVIRPLIEKLKRMGFAGSELLAWIPVYAVIERLFSVKRQLKAAEIAQLKQEIFLLEAACKEGWQNINFRFDKPRLLNSYFWLIDCYTQDGANKSGVDDILLKIKLLDENVYNSYVR